MPHPLVPRTLVGRTQELAAIQKILTQDIDFLLVGAPGVGRRTLIREAACQSGIKLVEIDCLKSRSGFQLLRLLADSLSQCFQDQKEQALIYQWSLGQPLTVEPWAEQKIRFSWPGTTQSQLWKILKALLALPQTLAEQLNYRIVIVFHNFLHLRSWDRQGQWESYLRTEIQQQSHVSYALILTVIEPTEVDLPVITLAPLGNDVMADWLVSALAVVHLKMDEAALDLFLQYVQGHLGDAITLAHRLWLDHQALGTPDASLQSHQVHRCMVNLIADLDVTFEALLSLLPPSQMHLLESLALDPTDSPQARAYIQKHQLSRGGGLQGALTSLEQKGLIYGPQLGYRVALPLLDFWLKQRVGL
jgi:hypothetical protein